MYWAIELFETISWWASVLKLGKFFVLLQAMSKDMKLNRMQHAPGALSLLCQRFHKYEKLADYVESQEDSKE